MTAPFQVPGQVLQSDTETGKHHHWNGDGRRQKSAILLQRDKNKTKTPKNQHLAHSKFVFDFCLKVNVNHELTTTSNHAPTIRPIL